MMRQHDRRPDAAEQQRSGRGRGPSESLGRSSDVTRDSIGSDRLGQSRSLADMAQLVWESPRAERDRQRFDRALGVSTEEGWADTGGAPGQRRAADEARSSGALGRGPDGGIPSPLLSGIQRLSGMDLSDVRVHRRSEEPAKLNALAFARGSDIHLGSGQERHIAHEAWHVVQQRQGRVRPTMTLGGSAINDDPGLEKEADRMGRKAQQLGDA